MPHPLVNPTALEASEKGPFSFLPCDAQHGAIHVIDTQQVFNASIQKRS